MTVSSGRSLRFQVAAYKHLVELDLNNQEVPLVLQWNPINSNSEGKRKTVRVNQRGIRVIGGSFSEILIKGKEI